MKRLFLASIASLFGSLLLANLSSATGLVPVVFIKTVIAATPDCEKCVVVEIKNSSEQEIDITDWSLDYSADGKDFKNLLQVISKDANPKIRIILPAKTTQAFLSYAPLSEEGSFEGGMNHVAGVLQLKNSSKEVVDQVGWGDVENFTGEIAPSMTESQFLTRVESGVLGVEVKEQDSSIKFEADNLIEGIDECLNIDGIQAIVPDGYSSDADGNCQEDLIDECPNLPGSTALPPGYEKDEAGNCFKDECLNLIGLQKEVPLGHIKIDDDCFDDSDIVLSELFINPVSVDKGKEFIELYNPTYRDVLLDGYLLKIDSKIHSLTAGAVMKAKNWLSVSDEQLGFTLVNSGSHEVSLIKPSGEVSSSTIYESAPEGKSWSNFTEGWQYTSRVTRDEANLLDEVLLPLKPNIKTCPAGQYYNESTSRCRKIIQPIADKTKAVKKPKELKACPTGQYRDATTNRCRKLSLASSLTKLKPCKAGQERDPITNRCRNIDGAKTTKLIPCKDGQERDPKTNRCRKIKNKTPPLADFKPEVEEDSGVKPVWLMASGAVILAASYIIWEWRSEIKNIISKIFKKGK